MSLKKIIGQIHLWLGLSSGIVVFIVAITGCLYAFQVEIQQFTQPYRFVKKEERAFLPPSQLKAIALRQLPGKHVHSVMYYGREDAARVVFYSYEPSYYYFVYLNPYSGKVLKVKNENWDFFRIVLMGHFYLWLPPVIGQPLVATATLVFVFLLITGMILWFPKKNAIKQRFTIRWHARWRRVNYDLHNVLGFYISWIVVIIALTGLVWGFQWFAYSAYTLAGGQKSLQYKEPLSDTTQIYQDKRISAEDKIWQKMKTEHPHAEMIEIHFPENKKSSILAVSNSNAFTYWRSDYQFFDQNTLQEIPVKHIYGRFKDARMPDLMIRMNYDLHVGSIWGFPGKLLAFFASLITASLPVTGFVIWWGRKNKKQPEKER
ncbi:MAG: PepSY-associated TM helix domain-containing protein [Microscillaceae bacterium]|nr:PepSY-associated TM helix domain-containing protein [Microscillaceae bacterium]